MKKLLALAVALMLALSFAALAEAPLKVAFVVQDMANESQSYCCRIMEQMAPTERSIPPVRTTMVIATAIRPIMEFCRSRL